MPGFLTLYDNDTSKYLQPNGQLGNAFATRAATLSPANATSTSFSLPVTLPQGGDWNVTAYAVDSAGQQDTSTSGATARYRIYPGDVAPTLTDALLSPTEGTTFNDGRIFVSGRAEDDQAMQNVQVSIMNSSNLYMNSSGAFPTTSSRLAANAISRGRAAPLGRGWRRTDIDTRSLRVRGNAQPRVQRTVSLGLDGPGPE